MKRDGGDGGKYWDSPGSRLTVSEGRDAMGMGRVRREGGPREKQVGRTRAGSKGATVATEL